MTIHKVGGYQIELEDQSFIDNNSVRAVMSSFGDLPERVDPRKHPQANSGFLRIENQGSIGSCQGASLTECGEWAYNVGTGKVIQFSKMYAYLTSQMKDNIRGDRGSTLSGGTKAAKEGLCTEANAPYTRSYPGWGYVTSAMRQEAAKYKLKSYTRITQEEQVKSYLGSGIGAVQIGISWNRSMSPDRFGLIKSFSSGGGGGHGARGGGEPGRLCSGDADDDVHVVHCHAAAAGA